MTGWGSWLFGEGPQQGSVEAVYETIGQATTKIAAPSSSAASSSSLSWLRPRMPDIPLRLPTKDEVPVFVTGLLGGACVAITSLYILRAAGVITVTSRPSAPNKQQPADAQSSNNTSTGATSLHASVAELTSTTKGIAEALDRLNAALAETGVFQQQGRGRGSSALTGARLRDLHGRSASSASPSRRRRDESADSFYSCSDEFAFAEGRFPDADADEEWDEEWDEDGDEEVDRVARDGLPYGERRGRADEQEGKETLSTDRRVRSASESSGKRGRNRSGSSRNARADPVPSRHDAAALALVEELDAIYLDNPSKAVEFVRANRSVLEQHFEGWWRIARSAYDDAVAHKGNELEFLVKGQEIARKAIDMQPDSANAHKWYAIITGAKTDYLPLNEKMECGNEFKKHVDIAYSLNPNDALLSHLLGRWSLEVAGLPWVAKKACQMLFGAAPEATYEQAVVHLEKANELSPGWALNMLFLGKALRKVGQENRGTAIIREVSNMNGGNSKEDTEAVTEAKRVISGSWW